MLGKVFAIATIITWLYKTAHPDAQKIALLRKKAILNKKLNNKAIVSNVKINTIVIHVYVFFGFPWNNK